MSIYTHLNTSHLQERAILSISDDDVREKTGRVWVEWDELLDTCEIVRDGFDATARYIRDEFHLSTWWARVVASRYHLLHDCL